MVKKSTPKGIDFANPQKNFVKASFDNKDDPSGFWDYMYGSPVSSGSEPRSRKASGYGHNIGQRAGKLRLSGTAGAHRIGKRKG